MLLLHIYNHIQSISFDNLHVKVTQLCPTLCDPMDCTVYEICDSLIEIQASLVAQLVKNPPAMWETWVRSLGWDDALEKGKATHSSIPAGSIPWTV